MPILPLDANGHEIAALAPGSTTEHTLQAGGASALAADTTNMRIVRLFTDATDCKVAVGASNTTPHMPLVANMLEALKIEPGMTLYASGNGTLSITVMQ